MKNRKSSRITDEAPGVARESRVTQMGKDVIDSVWSQSPQEKPQRLHSPETG